MNLKLLLPIFGAFFLIASCSNLSKFGSVSKSTRSKAKKPALAKSPEESETEFEQDSKEQEIVPGSEIQSEEETMGTVGTGYSLKAQVRLKKPEMLQNSLAVALDLAPADVCKELGLLSCTGAVHKVIFGGTDAYKKAIYAPSEEIGITAPMAGDRVVLSACSQRVNADFQSPAQAIIFKSLVVDANGSLANASSAEVGTAIGELYRRGLQRNPTADELAAIVGFHQDLITAGSKQSAKEWALLSCYAVMSTIEAFFY